MSRSKIVVLVIVLLGISLFFVFDLQNYLSLSYFVSERDAFIAYFEREPVAAMAAYFVIYVIVTALSLPGAAVMTLVGGAVFGLWLGVVVVSFASTIGATLAFLVSRFMLKDFVQSRYENQMRSINRGIDKEGSFYLFMLRMVPLFPFFVINLVMGITRIGMLQFYLVSQIGMLLGTFAYVYAGTQLGLVNQVTDILSPGLIGAFVILGLLPLAMKKLIDYLRARRIYRGVVKPTSFDANTVVIGAGSAGLVAAIIASTVKAKVTLVERHKMGGDCLNTGCVPSKTLIRSAKISSYMRRAGDFGLHVGTTEVDFPAVMKRVKSVIKKIEPHDSIERYTSLGVDCITGTARIVDPYRVDVDGKVITTRSIVVATGACPFIPPIAGIEELDLLTSDNVWDLQELPQRLLVLGGGPIGCELAQSFARLGANVTIMDMVDRLLPREDADVAEVVQEKFVREGIKVLVDHRAVRFEKAAGSDVLIASHAGQEVTVSFDKVLVAVGRKAHTESLGLSEVGIELNSNGTLAVNEYLQTAVPNIYACGDVIGPYQFTHMASHQAWYAMVNALFGWMWKFRVNYRVVPWATYTDPEVALVGLNELSAKEQDIAYEVTRYDLEDVDRALADGESEGFIKVLTVPGSDRILGATIVGYHAGELIGEYVTAMTHGLGLNKILATIHIYPTLGEVNKFAASAWKKANAPQQLLGWVGRVHRLARREPASI